MSDWGGGERANKVHNGEYCDAMEGRMMSGVACMHRVHVLWSFKCDDDHVDIDSNRPTLHHFFFKDNTAVVDAVDAHSDTLVLVSGMIGIRLVCTFTNSLTQSLTCTNTQSHQLPLENVLLCLCPYRLWLHPYDDHHHRRIHCLLVMMSNMPMKMLLMRLWMMGMMGMMMNANRPLAKSADDQL